MASKLAMTLDEFDLLGEYLYRREEVEMFLGSDMVRHVKAYIEENFGTGSYRKATELARCWRGLSDREREALLDARDEREACREADERMGDSTP